MKRLIILFVFALLMGMSINAQQWTITKNNGDELKGTPAYTSYIWMEDNGAFAYKDTDDTLFLVSTKDGIFNSNGQRGRKGRPVTVGLVGFYTPTDSLIEKMELTYEINEGSQSVYPNQYTSKGGNNYKRSRKIIDFIKNGNGYVRFIIPRYAKNDLELKVQCNNQ